MAIFQTALVLALRAFKPSYFYKKAGVLLGGIVQKGKAAHDLFAEKPSANLDDAIDEIRRRYGRGPIVRGSERLDKPWMEKRDFQPQHYTMDWDALPEAR